MVKGSALKGTDIDGEIVPRIIDEIPILAVAATQAKGVTRINEAKELRFKEADRIKALKSGLSRMGAMVDEREDGLVIEGPSRLNGTKVDSFGDHRIAMALIIAGLIADGETTVSNTECINISFPGFMDRLDKL